MLTPIKPHTLRVMMIRNYSSSWRKLLLAGALGALGYLTSPLGAQVATLRTGKLPNGLTYYISRDAGASVGTANFYLLQNVGALLENDQQNGLAHYLEHMAFNATRHFPSGVMTYLRQRGLYGFDARTGQDETRYSILDVPTDAPRLTDSVLLILHDWCGGVSITQKDTDKERGIIIEEWRSRNSLQKRLSDAIAPAVYNDSQYARRNVIGSLDVLRTFTYKDIQAFYKTWYRPDLQCVIIVGDIDPAAYEAKVKKLFSSLPANKKEPVRPTFTIEDNAQPRYLKFIDKENQYPSFGLYQRVATPTDRSAEERRRDYLLGQLFNRLSPMLYARLRNRGVEGFIAASVSYSPLVRGYGQFAWDVVPYPGHEEQALKQVIHSRAQEAILGFDKVDFDNEKQKLYDEMKEVLSDKQTLGTPDNFMDIYRNNYLYGTPMKDFREQIEEQLETLVELESEDLRQWVKAAYSGNKNLAFITYQASESEPTISPQTFESILEKYSDIDATRPQVTEEAPITKLIDFTLPTGKIISEKKIPSLGATEWKLSNGMRVLYKYLPEDLKGEIFFLASAPGGQSIVANKDLASFSAMQSMIMQSGLYKYNRNQLASWLRGRPLDVSLTINQYMDGMQARSKVDGADDLFSYLYLVLQKQRFDEPIFTKWLQRKRYIYASTPQVGQAAIDQQVRELLTPITEANPRQDDAFFTQMRHADLERLYKEHFGDASQFVGCLLGDLSEAEAKRLVTTYLAALPGDPQAARRTYKVVDHSSRERVIERTFEADLSGDVGEVELSFLGDKKLTERESLALSLLEVVLQNRLFDELRERDQATYSVAVNANYTAEPIASSSLSIHFSTSREKADQLKARTYEILRSMAAGGITQDEFKKVHVPLTLDEAEREKQAGDKIDLGVWIALLNSYAETGVVPDMKAEKRKDEVSIADITVSDLSAILKKLLDEGKRRDIVVKSLAPEDKKWEH